MLQVGCELRRDSLMRADGRRLWIGFAKTTAYRCDALTRLDRKPEAVALCARTVALLGEFEQSHRPDPWLAAELAHAWYFRATTLILVDQFDAALAAFDTTLTRIEGLLPAEQKELLRSLEQGAARVRMVTAHFMERGETEREEAWSQLEESIRTLLEGSP